MLWFGRGKQRRCGCPHAWRRAGRAPGAAQWGRRAAPCGLGPTQSRRASCQAAPGGSASLQQAGRQAGRGPVRVARAGIRYHQQHSTAEHASSSGLPGPAGSRRRRQATRAAPGGPAPRRARARARTCVGRGANGCLAGRLVQHQQRDVVVGRVPVVRIIAGVHDGARHAAHVSAAGRPALLRIQVLGGPPANHHAVPRLDEAVLVAHALRAGRGRVQAAAVVATAGAAALRRLRQQRRRCVRGCGARQGSNRPLPGAGGSAGAALQPASSTQAVRAAAHVRRRDHNQAFANVDESACGGGGGAGGQARVMCPGGGLQLGSPQSPEALPIMLCRAGAAGGGAPPHTCPHWSGSPSSLKLACREAIQVYLRQAGGQAGGRAGRRAGRRVRAPGRPGARPAACVGTSRDGWAGIRRLAERRRPAGQLAVPAARPARTQAHLPGPSATLPLTIAGLALACACGRSAANAASSSQAATAAARRRICGAGGSGGMFAEQPSSAWPAWPQREAPMFCGCRCCRRQGPQLQRAVASGRQLHGRGRGTLPTPIRAVPSSE